MSFFCLHLSLLCGQENTRYHDGYLHDIIDIIYALMYVQSCGWILIIDSMYSAMSVNRDRAYPNIGHSPHFSSICIRPHTRTHTYMYTHTVHCVYIINLFIHSNSPTHTHPPTPHPHPYVHPHLYSHSHSQRLLPIHTTPCPIFLALARAKRKMTRRITKNSLSVVPKGKWHEGSLRARVCVCWPCDGCMQVYISTPVSILSYVPSIYTHTRLRGSVNQMTINMRGENTSVCVCVCCVAE